MLVIVNMNYAETTEYLFNSTPVFEHVGAVAYKEGLGNTLALDEHFGHPHRHYATIHIAGTNGKGSVSHTLAAILQCCGLRVGLYTSPHLVDFRERIRVNGDCIGEQAVVDFVERERHFFEPLRPSFFELTTALAFKHFAEQHVDVAVVETGLGGRLDCTNIVSPILSIITNISLDHTQFLGNTPGLIAREKAGIIKQGVPVVIGEHTSETRPVFEQQARRMQAPIVFADDDGQREVTGCEQDAHGMTYRTRHFGTLHGELGGLYQSANMNTVLCAVRELTSRHLPGLTPRQLGKAIGHVCQLTGLRGRWQQLQSRPTVVCDTGHNAGAWAYLSRQIDTQAGQRHIVFGMVNDKDVRTVMSMLPRRNATYYFTQPSCHRALPKEQVAAIADELRLSYTLHASVGDAYRAALGVAGEDDFVFVGGSSYVVADLLTALQP